MTALQTTAAALAAVTTVVGLGAFGLGALAVVRMVARGGPAPDRTRRPWRRTGLALAEILGHRRFRSRPGVRAAHWAVMLAFPILFASLVTSYGQIVDPRFVLPVVGRSAWLGWLIEGIAWLSLLGIAWLVVVRQRARGRRGPGRGRFVGSNAGQAYFVEAVMAVVVLCVLLLGGLEVALARQDGTPVAAHPLTAWFGSSWVGLPAATLETAVVLLATVKVVTSAVWLTVVGLRPAMGVAWHRFTAVANVWARRELDGRPALGAVPPVRAGGAPVDFDRLEDLPDDARLGVGRVEDLSWKGLLDLATCTECGRCQEQCPAWLTGKALSPKLMILALRDHAFATTPGLRPGPNAPTAPSGRTSATGQLAVGGTPRGGAGDHSGVDALALVGDVVEPQALWDCVMCGACVQACPVDIEHVDLFVDLRRHEVLMESAFPAELGAMFTGIERRQNPWGLPARGRLDWAADLSFPVPVVGRDVPDAADLDYLFWVGCAGSYDERARRTTRAVAELLHTAGVSFAVLGDAEGCTGDPARRAGNELGFQTAARATIATLTEARATRIVVTCPHCLNALSSEYPQLGAQFEVVHHTQLLDRLVAEGRLRPAPPDVAGRGASGTVTYHDPCYLGRHNGVYTPPRELVAAAGLTLTEMPRSGERSFCCGGGGAHVWFEESAGAGAGAGTGPDPARASRRRAAPRRSPPARTASRRAVRTAS